jgi:single-strand DNA-binding protein
MLNTITIMGRLTRDPELRRTGTGVAVASFTVAVDRDFADKQSGEKETDFIDCVAWRQTGEFVNKYFAKGSMIVVSGRLQIRSWTDKDGNKRRNAEVVADNAYFGDSRKKDSQNGAAPAEYTSIQAPAEYMPTQNPAYQFVLLEDDDQQLPF